MTKENSTGVKVAGTPVPISHSEYTQSDLMWCKQCKTDDCEHELTKFGEKFEKK